MGPQRGLVLSLLAPRRVVQENKTKNRPIENAHYYLLLCLLGQNFVDRKYEYIST
jgi:hypothetical protein